MADSSTFGAYGGSSTTDTPAAAPSGPGAGPQGPGQAGLDPGLGGVTTPNITTPTQSGAASSSFESIASKTLPGGGQAGAKAGTKAKPYDEAQLIQAIAAAMGIKATKGQPLEVAVVNALSSKYGVKIQRSTSGTGTKQGEVGSIRHGIASWWDSEAKSVSPGNATTADATGPGGLTPLPGTKNANESPEEKYAAALKIKSPKLRAQAIAAITKTTPLSQLRQQYQDQNPAAAPTPTTGGSEDESSQALNEMLSQVAQTIGAPKIGQGGLDAIAQAQGAPIQMPGVPGSAGTPQTAAQAYAAFTKAWTANGKQQNGQTFQQAWIQNLEDAGYLDASTNAAQTPEVQQTTQGKNGVTSTVNVPTSSSISGQQVNQAYQALLTDAVNSNQSVTATLQAKAGEAKGAGGPTSEMAAFVQGVATEFGVALTSNQVNEISNQYGASATTADNPTSVEDQIKDAVIQYYDPNNPNNPPGVANTMFVDIQQSALDYQIPISKDQIGAMVKNAMQGATIESMYVAADAAESAATETFQQQAEGLYPTLAPQIQAGMTLGGQGGIMTPYWNVAEQYTGVPASTMMADQQGGGVTKWGNFLQGGTDPKTGAPALQTLDQWKKTLMTDPQYGFDKTQGGKDMAEQMSSAILNTFGKVNTNGNSSQPFNSFNPSSALSANTASS